MIEMKTPISYYGGKQTMLKYIIPLIPEHDIYVEPFTGGGAVYWAKPPSKVEVLNDTNGHVVNFYEVLKTDFIALKQEIEKTIHSRLIYKKAMVIYEVPHLFSKVQQAWAFWVATNMGYSCKIGSWAFDYYGKTERKMNAKIENFTDEFSDRLKHTCIECNDAINIITTRDRANCFHYIDPPYVDSNQGHYAGYMQEDFNQLLKVLPELKGNFLMSTYDNAELTKYVKKYGWYQRKIEMFLSSSNTKAKKKVEVLTANYPI